jgi:hypothetical protein
MAVLRTHAMDALKACIALYVPELQGKICAGPTEAPKTRVWPHLAIYPVRFSYFPNQAHEHKELGASKVVMNVGRHEGLVQLRLGATTHNRRIELEEKVINVFLRTPGRPGVLVTEIAACHDATVAWELDTDEWQNELAFSKQWFSLLTVLVQIPALVTREGVYSIEELRLTLTEDLTTPYDDLPASQQETVKLLEDGSLEPG